MASVIKSRSDCDPKQLLFLTALESQDCAEVPRKDRWRWCAKQAGYPDTTSISDIVAPISKLIKEVSENILVRASVEASWTLSEAAGNGLIDAQTKDRISAAKDVLDRVVPKKAEEGNKNSTPIAILVLPAKQEVRVIEASSNEDIPAIKAD